MFQLGTRQSDDHRQHRLGRNRPAWWALAATVLVSALAASACGGGDDELGLDDLSSIPSAVDDTSQINLDDLTDDSDFTLPEFDPDLNFVDTPGSMRFANFVSDGTAGVDIDVYWGYGMQYSELMGTIPYGTITEFMPPRRDENGFGGADEARFSFFPAGATTDDEVLGQFDETMSAESRLTVAMSGAETYSTNDKIGLSIQVFFEHQISAPPAGSAHVYGWDGPWLKVESSTFAVVGSAELCFPDLGVTEGGNLGQPYVMPAGSTGVTLFDANTECATGSVPTTEALVDGASYVVIGAAPNQDLTARTSVLLQIGV